MTRATGMDYVPDINYGTTRANAAGYDEISSQGGYYQQRKNSKLVYTQRKLRDGQ